MSVFLTCLVVTDIFLLMKLNMESYRGDFQFPYTQTFCLLWEGGGVTGLLFVAGIQTTHPETFPCTLLSSWG